MEKRLRVTDIIFGDPVKIVDLGTCHLGGGQYLPTQTGSATAAIVTVAVRGHQAGTIAHCGGRSRSSLTRL